MKSSTRSFIRYIVLAVIFAAFAYTCGKAISAQEYKEIDAPSDFLSSSSIAANSAFFQSRTAYLIRSGTALPAICYKSTSAVDVFILTTTNSLYLCQGGNVWKLAGSAVAANSTTGAIPYLSATDTYSNSPLFREDANTISQRNGTNPQVSRIYNTYTTAVNNESGHLGWISNGLWLKTDFAGGGQARDLAVQAANVLYLGGGAGLKWQISTSGHFLGVADNTYDIGASAATRPRTGYFGTSVVSPKFETATNVHRTSGSGSPEGVVTASIGSIYTRTNGGAGTTLYIKESGTATNTGWIAYSASSGSATTGEQLLSTTVVDLNSTAAQDLLTASDDLIVKHIVVRNASTDLTIGGAPNLSFTENTSGVALASSVATSVFPDSTRVRHAIMTNSTAIIVTTGNKVQATPSVAFGAAATVTVDVFGYFIP